jgi:hypothetical protein
MPFIAMDSVGFANNRRVTSEHLPSTRVEVDRITMIGVAVYRCTPPPVGGAHRQETTQSLSVHELDDLRTHRTLALTVDPLKLRSLTRPPTVGTQDVFGHDV